MQVPERLALIGGSILLASTLIFTLKSQASNILPKIEHPISSIYDHAGDAQKASEFDGNFKQAQQKGWTTGQWGTANYYIDNNQNMYVGSGSLSNSLYNNIGDKAHSVRTLNFTNKVQAPSDSTRLLSGAKDDNDWNNSIVNINGTDKIDTRQVTNMYEMIFHNAILKDIDISNWNTSNVQNMLGIFGMDYALNHVNAANLDVSHVSDTSWSFFDTNSLSNLDLSNWHLSNTNMDSMFKDSNNLNTLNISNMDTAHNYLNNSFNGTNSLQQIILGDNTTLNDNTQLQGDKWHSGDTTLSNNQLQDNNSHPGTWTKQ